MSSPNTSTLKDRLEKLMANKDNKENTVSLKILTPRSNEVLAEIVSTEEVSKSEIIPKSIDSSRLITYSSN